MDYTELVNAAKAYSDRQDLDVSSNIDMFILMAEARINRVLKTQDQTHRILTPTFEGRESYALPPDYNGMRSIHFNTSGVDMEGSATCTMKFVTPEQITSMKASDFEESYYYYTILSGQIQMHNTLPGNGTLEMVFYRKVPNLSTDNTTNWLSDDNPDIYLAGIVIEIESFVKNYDAAKLWDARLVRSISELDNADTESRWAGSTMQIRTL